MDPWPQLKSGDLQRQRSTVAVYIKQLLSNVREAMWKKLKA